MTKLKWFHFQGRSRQNKYPHSNNKTSISEGVASIDSEKQNQVQKIEVFKNLVRTIRFCWRITYKRWDNESLSQQDDVETTKVYCNKTFERKFINEKINSSNSNKRWQSTNATKKQQTNDRQMLLKNEGLEYNSHLDNTTKNNDQRTRLHFIEHFVWIKTIHWMLFLRLDSSSLCQSQADLWRENIRFRGNFP